MAHTLSVIPEPSDDMLPRLVHCSSDAPLEAVQRLNRFHKEPAHRLKGVCCGPVQTPTPCPQGDRVQRKTKPAHEREAKRGLVSLYEAVVAMLLLKISGADPAHPGINQTLVCCPEIPPLQRSLQNIEGELVDLLEAEKSLLPLHASF